MLARPRVRQEHLGKHPGTPRCGGAAGMLRGGAALLRTGLAKQPVVALVQRDAMGVEPSVHIDQLMKVFVLRCAVYLVWVWLSHGRLRSAPNACSLVPNRLSESSQITRSAPADAVYPRSQDTGLYGIGRKKSTWCKGYG